MRLILKGLLICLAVSAHSQNFLSWKYNDRYFSLAAGTGSVTYFGDLNSQSKPNGRIKQVSLDLEARLLTHVSARIGGAYYQLEGRDDRSEIGSFEYQRNLSFESNNYEFNFQLLYYLKPYSGDYFSRPKWDPYFGGGVGMTWYNPYTSLNGEKYYLRDIATEPNKKYGNSTLVIPLTAGIKFKVNDFTNLNFELGYRFTTTDYLDDVSTVFPEGGEVFSIADQLANRKDEIPLVNLQAYDQLIPGANRGNNGKQDTYLFASFKVEIFLPNELFVGSKPKLKKSSIKN